MDRERQKTHFIYKGIEYPKSGNKKYDSYRCRIIDKGKEMAIGIDRFEYLLTQPCAYCGDVADTIDRIDSSKGYLEDNCAPSCKVCNCMKFMSTCEDFAAHIKKVYEHLDLGRL